MRSQQQKEEVKAKRTQVKEDAQEVKHLPEKAFVSFLTQNEVARRETSVLLSTKEKTKETETAVLRGDAEGNVAERETKEPASLNKERAQALE
jgi:hypothetical protein